MNRNYTFYLNEKTVSRLDKFCKKNCISKSSFLQEILDNSLDGIESLFTKEELDLKEAPAGLFFLNAFKTMSEQITKLAELQKEFLEKGNKDESLKK